LYFEKEGLFTGQMLPVYVDPTASQHCCITDIPLYMAKNKFFNNRAESENSTAGI